TIHETGNNAGRLKLVFDKPRKNTVKLLLLMDSGGSMDYYSHLCALLFQAVSKSNHFKDLKIYYFHNIIKGNLFTTPETHPLETISLDWMLRNLSNDYKVIIVGDARMNPGELEENTFCAKQGKLSGLGWFRALRDHFPHTVWLNPQEQSGGGRAFWNQTYYDIQKEVDMYPLTVESLGVAIKKLLAAR
ncbi:MAG: VWA domain-containing protein, partial [Synergistaceae bacterium]|nr:VWA domain-containing protein [Synergistaceae bacterium]